jgi:predicted amidohydrolase YtcJ
MIIATCFTVAGWSFLTFKSSHMCRTLAVLVIYCQFSAAASAEPADLVLRGGKVITAEPKLPSAAALAIRQSRIVALGSDEEISKLIGRDTRVIELAGRTAIPGFIEGHAHLSSIGEAKMVLDLTKAKSWDDIVAQRRSRWRVKKRRK